MQIFHLQKDPEACAREYVDSHIGNGFVHCCQMLSAVAEKNGLHAPWKPGPFMATAPMTLWVGATYDNWYWTLQHALALYEEQVYRWGTANPAYQECMHFILSTGQNEALAEKLPDGLTEPPKVMPARYRQLDLPTITSYRVYYTFDKAPLSRYAWKNRPTPAWLDTYDEYWEAVRDWRSK